MRSDQRYQLAAEGYIRGAINSTPCDHCVRGVEPFSRGLPLYPDCVSVPVDADADVADPNTCWLMRGACMSCYHRSYTDCSCRELIQRWCRIGADMSIGAGRLNEQGNPATPVAVRFPSPFGTWCLDRIVHQARRQSLSGADSSFLPLQPTYDQSINSSAIPTKVGEMQTLTASHRGLRDLETINSCLSVLHDLLAQNYV